MGLSDEDIEGATQEDLERAVGQMLVGGFDGAGEAPPGRVEEALGEGRLGGVILFSRNIDSLEQLVELNTSLHAAAAEHEVPPFVAVDQEGGPVMRVRDGLTSIPPMREIGAASDANVVADVSEVIATEIASLGFNLNFAPVLDVDSNPDNPIIGERAFGSDPKEVARAGGAFMYGHNLAGVIPCGKHFPGHGDTDVDSHLDLPVLMHDPGRLEEIEFEPFRAAIGAGLPMVMTAHILLPSIDAVHPATFSESILQRFLRDELGFDGVVVTDDLEMAAVADRYEVEEMVELGLIAGVDLFLICRTPELWERAYDQLLKLAETDRTFRERVLQSGHRVTRLKEKFFEHQPHPWTPSEGWREVLGSEEHREMLDI